MFAKVDLSKTVEYELPIKYSKTPMAIRRAVREQYVKKQNGRCFYCNNKLDVDPPKPIMKLKIDWGLFPEGFLNNPVHLHHDHDTDLTVGVTHAYCNAVLWQYHNE